MLIYITQSILLFFLFLFFGRFILAFTKFKSTSIEFNYFAQLFVGFYASVTIFSLIRTSGMSIASLLLIWSLIWIISSKKIEKPTFINYHHLDKKIIFELSIILISLVIINYFRYFGFSNSFPIVNNWDALSDVTRAIFLDYTGIENTNTNFIFSPSGTQPYHYFESWAVAMIANVFKGNYWISQNLIFQPIILILIYCGFRSLTKRFTKQKISIFFAIYLFFMSGLVNDYVLNIHFFEWCAPLKNNVIDEPWWTRLSVLYPIVILAIYFVLENKWRHGIFSLLLIPFISVTPSIPIIASTLITIVLLSYNNFNKKNLSLSFLPFLSGLLYYGFYFFFKDKSDYISIPGISEALKEISSFTLVKLRLLLITEKLIQTVILYSPYFLLILLFSIKRGQLLNPKNWRTEYRVIILFSVVIIFVSLLMWQLLNFVFGSSFFFYYTIIPILNSCVLLILFKLFLEETKVTRILVSGILACLMVFYVDRSIKTSTKFSKLYFTEKYSFEFLYKVKQIWNKEINTNGLALGIKLEDHSEIVHPFFNDGLSLCGYYLYGIADSPALISLSRGDLPEAKLRETEYSENFTRHTSFFQYVHLKKNRTEKNINMLKKNFITEHNIKYGTVTPKGKIPVELNDIIHKVIIDKLSGEKFIVFK